MKNKDGIKVETIYYDVLGFSSTKVYTPKGIFSAHSNVHTKDLVKANKEVGTRISEAKAKKKYYKACVNEVSAQIKAMEDFQSNLRCSHRYDENSYFAKRLSKEISMLYGRRAELKEKILNEEMKRLGINGQF